MKKTLVFCNCVGCGRRHEIWNGKTVPPGWRAFTAAHWPAGNPEAQALGPLYLRLCGACVEKMDAGPAFEPPKVTPVGNMHDLLQTTCGHHHGEDDE